MPTNLAIDDELLEKAQKLGGHRTKRATVNEALEEYIRRRKQLRSLDAIGTFDFDPKTTTKLPGASDDPAGYVLSIARLSP